ncbi:MAG TPA: hypothetical protein RMH99_08160 [Sandaracinaceae bacterium LLY-WYZ-13_1]|nr:hypothetical protein [Sandaracinaceae bacterium LLY-WYZ-13_1]
MKRTLLIALFAFGTVAGFGSGFASLACWHHRADARRAAFERHVADVCVEAADRARADHRDRHGHHAHRDRAGAAGGRRPKG